MEMGNNLGILALLGVESISIDGVMNRYRIALVVGVFFRLVSGSAAGVGTTMRNRPQDYSQKSREATAAIAAFAQYTHRHA